MVLMCFNSTLVRLRAGAGAVNSSKRRFNSTLVRLRGVNGSLQGRGAAGFQFHTGSIKGGGALFKPKGPTLEFQFHTGSIKGMARPFYSGQTLGFQFHTGSIKGVGPSGPAPSVPASFNSTLVRLRVNARTV